MNTRESINAKFNKIEKRYSKTTKSTKKTVKPKLRVAPILDKNKVGIKIKGTF